LWEVDTTSKDYQQEEIFESAILDGQELGVPLGCLLAGEARCTPDKLILCQFVGENCVGVVGLEVQQSKAFIHGCSKLEVALRCACRLGNSLRSSR
jgi:hypothetical protein